MSWQSPLVNRDIGSSLTTLHLPLQCQSFKVLGTVRAEVTSVPLISDQYTLQSLQSTLITQTACLSIDE
jgi:hypothetical protein